MRMSMWFTLASMYRPGPHLVPPDPPEIPGDEKLLDPCQWASVHFAAAELGDTRRSERLVIFASAAAADPAASIPQMCQEWADTKAAYRLFDNEHVTYTGVVAPHFDHTKECGAGTYLLLGDTTEINFGGHKSIAGAGPLGNGSGLGFLLHSSLLVEADTEMVRGLAAAEIHYRQAAPENETAKQRLNRDDRESMMWCRVIDEAGKPPEGAVWVHVLDRGADNFEVFCHIRGNDCDMVVRASSLHRKVLSAEGKELPVSELLQGLAVADVYELPVRARPKQPARKAQMEVRYTALTMPRPRVTNDYTKQQEAVQLFVVRVREKNPPKGVKRIEWVLYTTLPVTNAEEARRVIRYYEMRWLIEEYHKALKTGCRVEERQLEESQRLEVLTGILSVVAVRLLQLKSFARTQPDRNALEVVPQLYVEVLQRYKKVKAGTTWSVRKFFRELAKLGGFLARKCDGEPGWQTIWHGWDKLQLLVQGFRLGRFHFDSLDS